jgi:phenylalanyl-tRNA synthetase beta chain
MKFSYQWLRGFVDGLDVPAQALERLITMKTAECEGVEVAAPLLAGAAIARVGSVEAIEGTHCVKAVVDAGRHGIRTVVCGAPNCRVGMRTVWVPLGVKTVAGVASDGMLASGAELGINRDHDGILELGPDAELPVPDSVIEIDNKSLTHRPDLWGHYGMAREVAAITGKRLLDPVKRELLPAPGSPIKIDIEDLALCPRYSALVFENVTVMPSPLWLQARLTAAGLNPINNIVDLTNYLLAELAQPTHAFDRTKLAGDTIYARPARTGEQIIALNDETYQLSPSNLVIADASGPIAIAGVIGGRDSAISNSTTTIVLESANFNAASVRKTSSALKVRTDASMRFEKAQDPHNTVRALARALELLPLLSPGIRLVGGLADVSRELHEPAPVAIDLDWLARKLGRVVDGTEVRRILEGLQFGVTDAGVGSLSVSIPSWRATKDISVPEDVVEEVGRMIGYESIEPTAPLVSCAPSFDPPEREFLRRVKRMVAAQGYTEVSNYSFISEEEARRFGLAVEDHVRVLNPIAAGQELLRTSLLPGIHRNVVENAKHADDFRLFETGREIHKRAGVLPEERLHLMAAIYAKGSGDQDQGRAGLLELKRIAECLAPGLEVHPAEATAWEHTARCADVLWNGTRIGRLSELHPDLVETGRAAVLDLDLALLQQLTSASAKYEPIRRFPSSAFDLSIIAGARDLAGDLRRKISEFGGSLVEGVEYVREYQGLPVAEGRKSVTFRVTAGDSARTLTAADIAGIRASILAGLAELGYDTRV